MGARGGLARCDGTPDNVTGEFGEWLSGLRCVIGARLTRIFIDSVGSNPTFPIWNGNSVGRVGTSCYTVSVKTCENCQSLFPESVIVQGKRKSLRSRRFCLKCSPYKNHNTRCLASPRSDKSRSSSKASSVEKLRRFDWTAIQKFYDEGATYVKITERFGVCSAHIALAASSGLLRTRSVSQAIKLRYEQNPRKPVSEETRRKISKSRLEYLRKNPDKVPYLLNHSNKKSYPEKLFEEALEEAGVSGFVYNFSAGIYQYDFAFPSVKLDVEIDGATHLSEKVKKIDKRRDEWTEAQGWSVLRFTALEVKEDASKCVQIAKALIGELQTE